MNKEILIIQTGGTIDKEYPRLTKGYAFEIGEPSIKRILSKINPSFTYEIVSVLKKDSTDITKEDRQKIYDVCEDAQQERIVITHGTDTMVDTAKELVSLKEKTIIITGSMRPEKFSDSDADFNIGLAFGAVQTLPPGIYISMHGIVAPWEKVSRNEETGQYFVEV